MVEFAIVLPLLLLVIVGLIEFGITFNSWLSLNHLSNEGARWAAVGECRGMHRRRRPHQDLHREPDLVRGTERRGQQANGYVTLCVPSATPHVGDPVTVEIGVNPYSIFNLTGFKLMDVNLGGSSTMRPGAGAPGTARTLRVGTGLLSRPMTGRARQCARDRRGLRDHLHGRVAMALDFGTGTSTSVTPKSRRRGGVRGRPRLWDAVQELCKFPRPHRGHDHSHREGVRGYRHQLQREHQRPGKADGEG